MPLSVVADRLELLWGMGEEAVGRPGRGMHM